MEVCTDLPLGLVFELDDYQNIHWTFQMSEQTVSLSLQLWLVCCFSFSENMHSYESSCINCSSKSTTGHMNKWNINPQDHKMKSDMQVFAVEMCCVGVIVSVSKTSKTPTAVSIKAPGFQCALTI